MEELTKEEHYEKLVEHGVDRQKKIEKRWAEVEALVDGDYRPLLGKTQIDHYVKTYMLPTAIETQVAITMPPPNFKFIGVPSNKNQEPDINSAKTAEALADYFIQHNGGYAKIEDGCGDYFLLNRCVFKVGYRPDDRGEEDIPQDDLDVVDSEAFYTEGGDNGKGQPYFNKINRRDFIICDGAKTIREAEAPGGWVAYRVYPHISWVKNNPAINAYVGKDFFDDYNGTLRYPYEEIDLEKTRTQRMDEKNMEMDYVRIWYVYEYPTAKKPDGTFAIYDLDQRKVLYEVDNFREILGLDFPFFEAVDSIPRKGFYAIPKSVRARNAQLRTEYFETKHLELTRDSKNVLVVPEDAKDEVLAEMRDNDEAIVVLESKVGTPQDGVYNFNMTYDLEAVERGALRSRGQFQEIIGPNFADPRMGDKIATEMVFQNKLFTTKANRHIININKLIEQIVTALITITKTMVSPEEQMRITRSVEGVWMDDDEITLDGNYAITIKGTPLLDMTEGERGQTMQNIAQWLVGLQGIPEYQGRIDVTPIVQSWLDFVGLPSAGVIRESAQTEDEKQWWEIAMMLSGFEMPVEQDDNDMKHLAVLEEYVGMLQQQGKELDINEDPMFQKHAEAHMQKMQAQQQGAQGVSGQNDTNLARQAAGSDVGGSALTGPVGGNNNV